MLWWRASVRWGSRAGGGRLSRWLRTLVRDVSRWSVLRRVRTTRLRRLRRLRWLGPATVQCLAALRGLPVLLLRLPAWRCLLRFVPFRVGRRLRWLGPARSWWWLAYARWGLLLWAWLRTPWRRWALALRSWWRWALTLLWRLVAGRTAVRRALVVVHRASHREVKRPRSPLSRHGSEERVVRTTSRPRSVPLSYGYDVIEGTHLGDKCCGA